MKITVPDIGNKHIIFVLIFMLSNRLQTIGDSFFGEISTKQWFVTLMLGIMDGHAPTLSELSDAVGSSRQNVKQLVLKLEQKGYVTLVKDDTDARCLRIHATPKCKEFHMAYHQKSSDFTTKSPAFFFFAQNPSPIYKQQFLSKPTKKSKTHKVHSL